MNWIEARDVGPKGGGRVKSRERREQRRREEMEKKKQYHQWEFQDPKMEVLYHIRLYFVVIFPYIGLT